jgi:hypothetical protein
MRLPGNLLLSPNEIVPKPNSAFSPSHTARKSKNRESRSVERSGLAGVVNGISKVHEEFLNDGGLGILVGDGMLPHPVSFPKIISARSDDAIRTRLVW